MRNRRTILSPVLMVIVLAAVPGVTRAQFRATVVDDVDDSGQSKSVVVQAERRTLIAFEEAQELLKNGQPVPALGLLQQLLDQPGDFFLDETLQRSLKQAIGEVIRSQPADVRATYELLNSATAERLRERWEEQGDETARRELYRRFSETNAARQAMLNEARRAFDGGRPFSAALWWNALRGTSQYQRAARTAWQHSLAWLWAGRGDLATGVLSDLPQRPGESIRLGGRELVIPDNSNNNNAGGADWLLEFWPGLKPALSAGREHWLMFRGGESGNALAGRTGPIGALQWSLPITQDYAYWTEAEYGQPRPAAEFEEQVRQILDRMRLDGKLIQPAMHPLVVGNTVVIRSPFFLSAYSLDRGKLLWRSLLSNSGLAEAWGSLPEPQQLEGEPAGTIVISGAREAALQEWMLQNQTTGQLAASDRYVYAIERSPFVPEVPRMMGFPIIRGEITAVSNRLAAYELSGGRLVWELGAERDDAYFLGPPLCLKDQLYCLVETRNGIELQQYRETGHRSGPQWEWSIEIAAPQAKLPIAPLRRLSGLTPTAADDLLICSSSSGLVVAVDPIRQQLVWGYEYPSIEEATPYNPRQIMLNRAQGRMPVEPNESEGRWLDALPVFASGRVLLTPRDSTELHCLDAVTGELIWKRPREQALYIAGVLKDRVLLVHRNAVEALHLATGEPVWPESITISEPAGRGLVVDRQLLVPLQSGEIVAIDWERGLLRTRSRLSGGRVPGNLAAGSGALVSQGAIDVLAYQPLPLLEQQIADRLQTNPEDAVALALRGELRLHEGQDAAAVADLRKALSLERNPQASLVLVDVLMSRLRQDFPRNRAEIAEIERLIEDEYQRTDFLTLTAVGFERQGDLLGAFEQYLKLSTASTERHPLSRTDSLLTIRRDRMIRGHLWNLFELASVENRTAMERELQRRLQMLDAGNEAERLRFLDYFDGLPQAAETRLQMLSVLPDDQFRERLSDWMRLAAERQPEVAAAAIIRLADDAIDRGAVQEVRAWSQLLGQNYRGVRLASGDSVEEWFSRKQKTLQLIRNTPEPGWPTNLEPTRAPRSPVLQRQSLVEQLAPLHPLYRDWIFEFQEGNAPVLVARNAAGQQQWTLSLPSLNPVGQIHFATSRTVSPQLSICGTHFVLSLGTTLFAFEVATPEGPPLLSWQRSLIPDAPSQVRRTPIQVRAEFMRNGRRRIRAFDSSADLQCGQLLGLTCEQVVYQVGNRVVASDPQTGAVLWIRYDVPRQLEGTASDRVVVLLDTISQEALVLRAADGELTARRNLPDPHNWLWFEGERILTQAVDGDGLLAMTDLTSGAQLWSTSLEPEARCCVLPTQEIACLYPDGRWQVLDLNTGRERSSGTAPDSARLDFLWVQPEQGGYLVVAGAHGATESGRTVTVFDGNQVTLDGAVWWMPREGKLPRWQQKLPPTAFSVIQPSSVPLLTFAGRVIGRQTVQQGGRNIAVQELSAIFLDRRTGDILYETRESPPPGMFSWIINGDEPSLVANFLNFQIEFRPPQPKKEPDIN